MISDNMRKVKIVTSREVTGMSADDVKLEYSEGKFHQWGLDYKEGKTGTVSYTVGIVELEDGQIISVRPEDIKFLPGVWDDMLAALKETEALKS